MSFFSAKNDISSSSSVNEEEENEELAAWRDPAKDQAQSSLDSFHVETECNSSSEYSDDGVCFGGYSIEEAKKDVKRTWARPITKRHSSISRFQYLDVSKEMDKVTNQIADLLTNPSQDVTLNECLEVDESENSEFLNKLEKCINEPMSAYTSYNTAFDQTNMGNNGDNPMQDCPDDSIVSISDDSSSQLAPELLNEESTSPVMIFMREECQEPIREAIKDDDSFRSAIQASFVNKVEVDNVVPRLKPNFNLLSGISEKTEFSTSEFVSFSSNGEASSNMPEIQIKDDTSSSYEDISGSFTSEASENQLDASTSSVKNDYFTTESSEDKIASSTSSQSDLDSYERRVNNSIHFDDTLEEMNRFLAQGSDYVMPEKTTPVKNEPNLNQNPFLSPISGSFENDSEGEFPYLETKQHNRNCYSAEKVSVPKPTLGPSKSATKPKLVSRIKPPFVTTNHGGKAANPIFKLPNRPIKTPSKLNPSLKNVVSPVGVYIKHSPKVCPMRNAPPKSKLPLCKMSYAAPSFLQKENIPASLDLDDIPAVIYKPAKKQIATEVRQVNLPNSINKLVTPQIVTKHEGRTDYCNQSIERRLMESDYSISQSDLDTTAGDVSILTHNQPFNFKKF